MTLKRTALFEEHKKLGGKLIDFGGWELPVLYSSVLNEHLACRNAVGLFDVSHMGEILVTGRDAAGFLDFLVTNHVSKLDVGQAQYTVMCHEHGGIVDDLVIYRRGDASFLVVVNASNCEKDYAHFEQVRARYLREHSGADVKIANESARFTQIAVQGRHAEKIVAAFTDAPLASLKNYTFCEGTFGTGKIPTIFARTGYTGEDGFELYVPWESGPEVWRALLEKGQPLGLLPCGLGARDTLRLEMKYPLYGHELNDQTNPLDCGLGWVVKLEKPGTFVGKDAIAKVKAAGPARALVGLKMLERGIPRQGYAVMNEAGERIGEVTSGTQSPSLSAAIAIASIPKSQSALGHRLWIDIRGARAACEVVATPFYKRNY